MLPDEVHFPINDWTIESRYLKPKNNKILLRCIDITLQESRIFQASFGYESGIEF